MNTKTTETLEEIFRAVFSLPPGSDVAGIRQLSTPTWDSLAHVALVTAIESELGITIDASDQLRMTSFASTGILLEERGL